MSEIQVIEGDCLEVMKLIPSDSVDMIFVDFPFGTTQAPWDKKIDLSKWWPEAIRVLKSNGVVLAKCQFPFTIELAKSNEEWLRYDWVWEKTNATGHFNARRMPLKAHETLLTFYGKLPTYNPQKTTGHPRKTMKAEHRLSSKKSELYGKYGMKGYDSTERFPRSVQVFASDKQKRKSHSTQTPVALVEYYIRTYTNEGETVLDTCAGSETTALACINTKRKGILIEIDPDKVKDIKEKLNGE